MTDDEKPKYRHRVINSMPPQEHVLTPAEMGAPFHALMQGTTDKKNEERKAKGEKPIDMDAMPIFRMEGPHAKSKETHGFSLFNMIPHNMTRRTKKKDGKEIFEK